MKEFFLSLVILISCLSAAISQTKNNKVWSSEVKFVDGTTIGFTREIRQDKTPLKVTIFQNRFQGKLFDVGKPHSFVNAKTLAAIAKKNKNIAWQIKRKIKIGYGVEQDSNKIGLIGFYDKRNETDFKLCMKPENHPCAVEGDAVVIQIKFKDSLENLVLVKSLRFTDRQLEFAPPGRESF